MRIGYEVCLGVVRLATVLDGCDARANLNLLFVAG